MNKPVKKKTLVSPIDKSKKIQAIAKPDRIEISKVSHGGMSDIVKMNFEKEMQKQQLKGQRILHSQKDRKIHALDTIIEWVEPYYPAQKNIDIDYYHFNYEHKVDEGNLLAKVLDTAKNKGCFNNFTSTRNYKKTVINFVEVNLDKIKKYRNELLGQQNKMDIERVEKQKNIIPIKNIRIDKNSFLLEINNGEENVFFKIKQKGTGLEKETKLFKIIYHLWDFRKELKDDKIIQKGDYVLLDNLAKGSNSASRDATYKNITRLNKRFENKRLAIKIEGKLGKYQLVIHKI